MTRTKMATLLLAQLDPKKFWTAASLAERAGITTRDAKDLLNEFWLDGLVESKPHDCQRLTYRLA